MFDPDIKDIEVFYKNHLPFNIRFQKRWVHSKYPDIEAKRQFQEFYNHIKNHQVYSIFFIKVGLGYIFDFFFDFHYDLFWYEPNINIRNIALERLRKKYTNFELNYQNKLTIIKEFSPKFIQEWGEKLLFSELFYLRTYLTKEDYITIDLYYRKKFYYSVNYQTVKKFEKLWISNFYKNFLYAQKFYPVDILKNVLKGFPVVIASAGPSLDRWIRIIKKYQNRFFILCVDTAFYTLVKNQIQVDFLVSVDAQFINYLHLEGLSRYTKNLLIDPLTCPLTVRDAIKNSKVFVYHNSLPFVDFLYNKLFSEISFIKSGGSVTTTAFDFANFLSADKIFLLGTDFSFVNRLIHTKYSKIENRFLFKTNRIFSLEFFNYKQITAIPRKYCLDVNKNKIPTNDKLIIFKEWFEKNIPLNPNKEIFLLYGNGYDLQGTKKVYKEQELGEILTQYPVLDKENYLEKIIKNYNKKNSIYTILNSTYKHLLILKEKLEILIQFLEDNNTESKNILELENDILNFPELRLLQFTEIHKLSFSSNLPEEILQKQLEEIYKTIKLNLEFHLECIKKSLFMLHSNE